MLFLPCTVSSKNRSSGQVFPSGTTGKGKALLTNPALIYLAPWTHSGSGKVHLSTHWKLYTEMAMHIQLFVLFIFVLII